jgi:hypothetical protein
VVFNNETISKIPDIISNKLNNDNFLNDNILNIEFFDLKVKISKCSNTKNILTNCVKSPIIKLKFNILYESKIKIFITFISKKIYSTSKNI